MVFLAVRHIVASSPHEGFHSGGTLALLLRFIDLVPTAFPSSVCLEVNAWCPPPFDPLWQKLSLLYEWGLGLVAQKKVVAASETTHCVHGRNGSVFEDEVGDWIWHEEGACRRHDAGGA